MGSCKLHAEFPERHFEVVLRGDTDASGLELTFCQKEGEEDVSG
jgi:hypothetical protein